ncbi:hypothetical protein THRCLA_01086, partial [Thraustotheca clavata]
MNEKECNRNESNKVNPNVLHDDSTRLAFMSMKMIIPTKVPFRHGLVLSLLCTGFATIVAITTYYLNGIANIPIHFGTILQDFKTNPVHVSVNTLLQGSGALNMTTTLKPSLKDVYAQQCDFNDAACAAGYAIVSTHAWYFVGKAFALISDLNKPDFQDANNPMQFNYISNLNGENTPIAQFYIPGHSIAITCMIRRASFYLTQQAASTAMTDSLAFCSPRTYDPNWVCENDVVADTKTYVVQMNKGIPSFVGLAKHDQFYLNAGYVAELSGGLAGSVFIQSVPVIDEYQSGVVQASAPWDILAVANCANFNRLTGTGWLLQMQGVETMTWKCDSLMLTNSIVLW